MKEYHAFVKAHGKTAWKLCVKGWNGTAKSVAERIFTRAYPKRTGKQIAVMASAATPLMCAMKAKRQERVTRRSICTWTLQERLADYIDDLCRYVVLCAVYRYRCGVDSEIATVSLLEDCGVQLDKTVGWHRYGRKGNRRTVVAVKCKVKMLKGIKSYAQFINDHGMAVLGAVRTGTEFGCEVWDAVVAHRTRGGCSVARGYVVRCDNWAGFARTHKHAKSMAFKFRFHHTLETELKDVWDEAQNDDFMRRSIAQRANEIAAAY